MEETIAKMKADGEDEYKIMKQVRARDCLSSQSKNCSILQITRTSLKCVGKVTVMAPNKVSQGWQPPVFLFGQVVRVSF